MPGSRRAQAWRYHPAYRRPRHVHDEPEFNLVVAGAGIVFMGGERVEVAPGALVWIPPGLEHGLEAASADFDLVVVGFQQELLDRASSERWQAQPFTRRVDLLEGDPKRLGDELLGVAALNDAGTVEERLVQVLSAVAHRPQAPLVSERAAALLRRERALGRDELARRLGINRGDLSRRFHRDHGISITEYKNRARIMAFLGEAERRPGNLMQAALSAGFGSYSQCHRTFRRLFGVGPRDYIEGGGVDPNRFEPCGAAFGLDSLSFASLSAG